MVMDIKIDWTFVAIKPDDLYNRPYTELIGQQIGFEYKGKFYIGVIGINLMEQHPNEKLVIYVLSNQNDLLSRIIEVETLELKDVYLITLDLKDETEYEKKYCIGSISNGMPFGVMC